MAIKLASNKPHHLQPVAAEGRSVNGLIMKNLQIIGNLIPILLVIFAYSLFGDTEPNTPNYAGTVMAMAWIGVSVFAAGFVLLFISPNSLILLTTENRN